METTAFDKNMMAATFAEAGEHGTAKDILKQGGLGKASLPAPVKSKPYFKALFFGAVSISCYILLFSNEQRVTDICTLGGVNTIYPVLAAFFFSFIHGAFASNLLSSLGLEAKK
jgi:hypothetical protein